MTLQVNRDRFGFNFTVSREFRNSRDIFPEMGTKYTQFVHRISLQPVTARSRVENLTVISFEDFQRDPLFGHFRSEPTLSDESIPLLLEPPTTVVASQNVTDDMEPVTVVF